MTANAFLVSFEDGEFEDTTNELILEDIEARIADEMSKASRRSRKRTTDSYDHHRLKERVYDEDEVQTYMFKPVSLSLNFSLMFRQLKKIFYCNDECTTTTLS